MTILKALHPRDDIEKLLVSRKYGRIGFTSGKDCVDTSIQGIKAYI